MDPNTTPADYSTSLYTEPVKKGLLDNMGGFFIEFFETLVVFGAIFAVIYLFIAQFHKVSGLSMFPTMHDGDYLITEKVSYKLGEPKKGQIVVLKNPRDESQDFIKRIMAVPGDTIKIENNSVYVNGQKLTESYLPENTPTHTGAFIQEGQEIKAGANQYFVFGDNRNHSSDSREWGSITKKEIVGRALFRYWPPQTIGLLTDK
ncbi:MAG: signal peptidase I [Candidatus Daviesbacteria bacterium]|nr:signal peptidase I [Candidatus Daviesbacteria bacterium]